MSYYKSYVNSYLKERNYTTLDNRKSLDNVKVLTKEKIDLLNYRMYLIYKRIDETIEDLNYSKKLIAFEYAADNDFVVRLYKKITEANDKVRDLASMLEQAQNEGEPYDRIVSNCSEKILLNMKLFKIKYKFLYLILSFMRRSQGRGS